MGGSTASLGRVSAPVKQIQTLTSNRPHARERSRPRHFDTDGSDLPQAVIWDGHLGGAGAGRGWWRPRARIKVGTDPYAVTKQSRLAEAGTPPGHARRFPVSQTRWRGNRARPRELCTQGPCQGRWLGECRLRFPRPPCAREAPETLAAGPNGSVRKLLLAFKRLFFIAFFCKCFDSSHSHREGDAHPFITASAPRCGRTCLSPPDRACLEGDHVSPSWWAQPWAQLSAGTGVW